MRVVRLQVGQVVPVVMGDGNPDYTVGFGNDFKWRAISAYVLIDRQQGGMVAAGTWRHYYLGGNSLLAAAVTPASRKGRTAYVPADLDAPHTWTNVDDVAALLITGVTDERAWGRAWHVPSAPLL